MEPNIHTSHTLLMEMQEVQNVLHTSPLGNTNIGYTNKNSYLAYVPTERKVIMSTVKVVINQRVLPPTHA